ncbi:response regulator [Aliivibrio sp. S4TY2]|uniref:response regulator transcription factor n=1 Tax=unclassified Aliivibrio TaxID=2645654 RepID=UPI00237930ED|nr:MULTISPECIES: response regulator [unclassified Aliivibrio]MDD9155296.1 response regulator [Aliivibrio sp. S4TY2]MDD9159152.1 response regulator [Aliivibrio sp. S4TY1]MDD9163298.1 response regulator [Aliivibrio sp. S4MY2]MDD9167151.1 response regulator [Aliivibrio sp. S4MY4]MDD9184375.1 response regulator [Aliivibrio sp. S4MY3]
MDTEYTDLSTSKVYVVDDEHSVRESLVFMLEGYGFSVSEFSSGRAFLDSVDVLAPGCVILDSRMPDLRGQDVHELLNQQSSPLSVIFLTGHGDIPMAVDALKAGAVDFFQKPVDGEVIFTAIQNGLAASDKRYKSQDVHRAYFTLTAREQEVLKLIVQGMKNQQMADSMCVSLRTIEVHRSNLMKKLDVKSVVDLIMRYGNSISN